MTQLVKKFPASYGTERFICLLKGFHDESLWVQQYTIQRNENNFASGNRKLGFTVISASLFSFTWFLNLVYVLIGGEFLD
jgi:hypothetical protein